jgi:hypothetical protein
MIALLCFFLTLFVSPFKSKSRLEAENAALRHQLIVLQRRSVDISALLIDVRLASSVSQKWESPYCASTL